MARIKGEIDRRLCTVVVSGTGDKGVRVGVAEELAIFIFGDEVGIFLLHIFDAAAELEKDGISAKVVNIHTWKPIDENAIVNAAKETGAIVTCENHNVYGGLGSAVAEVVCKHYPVPMRMVGIQDEFGQVGKMPYLSETYHITAADIVKNAKELVENKAK